MLSSSIQLLSSLVGSFQLSGDQKQDVEKVKSKVAEVQRNLQNLSNARAEFESLMKEAREKGVLAPIEISNNGQQFTVKAQDRNSDNNAENSKNEWVLNQNSQPKFVLLVGNASLNRMELVCVGPKSLGIRAIDGKNQAAQTITYPAVDGNDKVFQIDSSGLMVPKDTQSFVREVSQIEKMQGGNPSPVQFAVGSDWVFVDVNGLSAAREQLRPLCASLTETSVATAAPVAKEQSDTGSKFPAERIDSWSKVYSIVDGFNKNDLCNYGNPFNRGSDQLTCFNSAGTGRRGAYGITFTFNSVSGGGTARVDMQGDRKLSSIIVETPASIFTSRSEDQLKKYVSPVFNSIGIPYAIDDWSERLNAGQNLGSRTSRTLNTAYHAQFLQGGTKFHFALIFTCGQSEQIYPACRR